MTKPVTSDRTSMLVFVPFVRAARYVLPAIAIELIDERRAQEPQRSSI